METACFDLSSQIQTHLWAPITSADGCVRDQVRSPAASFYPLSPVATRSFIHQTKTIHTLFYNLHYNMFSVTTRTSSRRAVLVKRYYHDTVIDIHNDR